MNDDFNALMRRWHRPSQCIDHKLACWVVRGPEACRNEAGYRSTCRGCGANVVNRPERPPPVASAPHVISADMRRVFVRHPIDRHKPGGWPTR